MYECRLHVYLAGHSCRAFEVIKGMPSLEHFTHIFSESDKPEADLASWADVILADLTDLDCAEALKALISDCSSEAQVILFADAEQLRILSGEPAFERVTDVWVSPMSDEEVRFRFSRWQRSLKMSKDYWQTSQYLEALINNVPNLIWYKDKDGVHEKVNDSFCNTVNKTRQQVEGRRHAYIWDVEQDGPHVSNRSARS